MEGSFLLANLLSNHTPDTNEPENADTSSNFARDSSPNKYQEAKNSTRSIWRNLSSVFSKNTEREQFDSRNKTQRKKSYFKKWNWLFKTQNDVCDAGASKNKSEAVLAPKKLNVSDNKEISTTCDNNGDNAVTVEHTRENTQVFLESMPKTEVGTEGTIPVFENDIQNSRNINIDKTKACQEDVTHSSSDVKENKYSTTDILSALPADNSEKFKTENKEIMFITTKKDQNEMKTTTDQNAQPTEIEHIEKRIEYEDESTTHTLPLLKEARNKLIAYLSNENVPSKKSTTTESSEKQVNRVSKENSNQEGLPLDEKRQTYECLEKDVKNIIDELLLESSEMKDSIVETGIPEEKTPPIICISIDEAQSSRAHVQYIVELLLEQIDKEIETKENMLLQAKIPIGDGTIEDDCKIDKSSQSEVRANNAELGNQTDGNPQLFKTSELYFSAPSAKAPRIPKTSWSFGETQDKPLPTITINNHMCKKCCNTNNEDVLKGLERNMVLFNNLFNELCSYSCDVEDVNKTNNDEQAVANETLSQQTVVDNSSPMRKSLKTCNILEPRAQSQPGINTLETNIASEEFLRDACLNDEASTISSSSSKIKVLSSKVLTKTNVAQPHTSSSSSNEQFAKNKPELAKKGPVKVVDISPREPMKNAENNEDSSISSLENINVGLGVSDTDYEGDYDCVDIETPMPKGRRTSMQELNSPEEVKQIEKNVEENDRLERRGCIVLRDRLE